MKNCTICHTGIYTYAAGVLKNNKVYLLGNHGELYLPKEIFLAREECEGGLIQYEIEGKWGFVDIHRGRIVIEPVWDYAGPFYNGYAHVALGASKTELYKDCYGLIRGGKHGYINKDGNIIVPIEYEDAMDVPYGKYFIVSKNGKWGVISHENNIMIPFEWDSIKINYESDLFFCAKKRTDEPYASDKDGSIYGFVAKWGVYDKNFNLIIPAELDEEPISPKTNKALEITNYLYDKKYFVIRKGKKYGILCDDGRLITNIEFSKKQVVEMMNKIAAGEFGKDL